VTRKRANRKLTVGIDLGDRSSRYCILDEQGEILVEGSMATTKKGFAQVLGSKPRSRVVLEVGTHSPWVSRYLADLGHEVIVANPRRVRLITDSTRKDDRLDAKTLARLARIDPELLSPIRHRSERAASGSDGDPGAGAAGGSADDVSQCRAGVDEVLRGTFGKLRYGPG
jgi:transposase